MSKEKAIDILERTLHDLKTGCTDDPACKSDVLVSFLQIAIDNINSAIEQINCPEMY